MSSPSNSLVFSPAIFGQFPELVAAMSLRSEEQPGNFSMLARGTTPEVAAANRGAFTEMLGVTEADLAFPDLAHGDEIIEVTPGYDQAERPNADAYLTAQHGRLIGVGVADCVAILLYDSVHQAVAAIHSGWRGTVAEIVPKTIQRMSELYQTEPASLYAWMSPAPDRLEYEVGHEVSRRFDGRYITKKSKDKDWLDNRLAVQDQLLAAGVPPDQLAVDPRSTIADLHLHSHRRDGDKAGRMLAVIGLRA